MRFYCLQHVPFETPGILADLLLEKGHSLTIIHLYNGDSLPTIKDLDGLIIMGGPMSIHDEADYPWLSAEKELIAAAIGANKKVLGICLGAQLIAAVTSGRVYPNPEKEIGFWPVHWTEDALRWTKKPLPPAPLFHWHGETFDLPPGAILLASTDPCRNQAFRLGDHVLGLQFHPEVTPGIIRDMVAWEGHELVPAPYIQLAATILQQLPQSPVPQTLVPRTPDQRQAPAPQDSPGPAPSEWPLNARPLLDLLLNALFNN